MKDGTILLYKYKKGDNLLFNIAGKGIVFFTGYPYTHIALYVNGKTYDYAVWKEGKKLKNGVRVTDGLLRADEYYEPTFNLTKEDSYAMAKYCGLLGQYPYSFLKLFSLAIVYPFRKIFKLLKWVPFDNIMFGDVCSVLPDEAYGFVGYDIFPDGRSGYTVPGMYTECNYFTKVE
jgi:hypothetical protein